MSEPTNSAPSAPSPVKSSHPKWDGEDAMTLRNFLEGDTGRRAFAWLKYWAPSLLDGSHVNKTLVASGEVKGYTNAIEFLRSLTTDNPVPEEPKVSDEYPDLDDENKWTDAQSKRD